MVTPNEIPHVLACDVGNATVELAAVHGEQTTPPTQHRIGDLGDLGASLAVLWEQTPEPKKLVASSVNSTALKALEAAAVEAAGTAPLVIGRDLPRPLDTDLAEPDSVGIDRLCAAVAAYDRIGTACVVADFGTAATIDCVSDAGIFLGGAILPGLALAAQCLTEHTADLPHVTPREISGTFGRTTEEAILSGLLRGARGALRELTEAYATELGHWPAVIVTGGDARLVCPNASQGGLVQAIVDDLVLRGIACAYYRTLLR
ncbi:MAG: type III pantothenate kinase [Phycisphaerae bacterium]|nr:type III pantothenate kinase [Phycisphaerae bacterium]